MSNEPFSCPICHKNLAFDNVGTAKVTACPHCGASFTIPAEHRVVTLAEAPETKDLLSKPAWEQELLTIESALRETQHQRQESGNLYKQHASEANRQKLRIEKLDAKLKELEVRKLALQAEHSK